MENITPEVIIKWTETFWQIGWRGLVVFAVIAYREVVIAFIKGLIEIAVSRLKIK